MKNTSNHRINLCTEPYIKELRDKMKLQLQKLLLTRGEIRRFLANPVNFEEVFRNKRYGKMTEIYCCFINDLM